MPYEPKEHSQFLNKHDGVPRFSRDWDDDRKSPELTGEPFNKHSLNSGKHVSPYNTGTIWIGNDGIEVELVTDFDDQEFFRAVSNAVQATTGLAPDSPEPDLEDVEELLRGGALQQGLETVKITFAIHRVSRACTHQLVRTRKAGFQQQSQRATFYGEAPEVRIPETVWNDPSARDAALKSTYESWAAYRHASERDIPYQDARVLLPEGTVNYIQCTYDLREWLNTFSYRACYMFQHEIGHVFRLMREVLVAKHPWLEKHAQISCVKAGVSTFSGWESVNACPVETCCDATRRFKPSEKNKIG